MEDIKEISSAHQTELTTLRAELDRRWPAPPDTEAECVQLRSQVASLEDELADLTQRFATLDHTWVEERATLEVRKAKTSSRANGLALELVQVKAYIHSTLSMEYGWEGDKPSESQTELAEREEALRVATAEVGTLQALLRTKRQRPTSDSMMERELGCLRHSYDILRGVAKYLGFDAAELLHIHAHDDLILRIGFERLCQAMSDHSGHI